MKELFINFLANIFSVLALDRLVPNFSFQGDIILLLGTAAILSLANYMLKPMLKIIFFPFIVLTFGLFTIFVNMLVLWVITQFPLGIQIQDISALFYATILFSGINFLLHLSLHQKR